MIDKRNAEYRDIREQERRRRLERRVDEVHDGDVDGMIIAAHKDPYYTDADLICLYRIKAERELEAERDKAVLRGLSSVPQCEFHH